MSKSGLVLKSLKNGVFTLKMNNPSRLNGWTENMLAEIFEGMREAKENASTKVLIMTGVGDYYCAGVDLAGTLFKPNHPQKLWDTISLKNKVLFDNFLDFPKPILVAVNGHAIGASVTSATLCDGIIASSNASFSTPFQRLGIPPEGCSSVHFARVMNPDIAKRMLHENLKLNAFEAKSAGFVVEVYPPEQLSDAAQSLAESWIATEKRRVVSSDLKEVNAQESRNLATAFLSPPFLWAQYSFLLTKKRYQPAAVFAILAATHPLWRMLVDYKKNA